VVCPYRVLIVTKCVFRLWNCVDTFFSRSVYSITLSNNNRLRFVSGKELQRHFTSDPGFNAAC